MACHAIMSAAVAEMSLSAACVVSHIPSSKRQQDAADCERGRPTGRGGLLELEGLHLHLHRPVVRFKEENPRHRDLKLNEIT